MCGFLRNSMKRGKSALLSVLLALVMGGVGGPFLTHPETRSGESQESAPISERQEEFTHLGRFDHERQLKLEQRRQASIFEVPSSHLGHTQNSVLPAPSGHRLSNGLLAPITC
jgi:hypothetical protein